jgi:glycosyltransferase involved in cell wall biosynthesis
VRRFGLVAFLIRGAIESAVNSEPSVTTKHVRLGVQLIYVGRLVEIKSPTDIPSITSQLPQQYSLRIVGNNTRWEKIKEVIESSEVDDRIELEGKLLHGGLSSM